MLRNTATVIPLRPARQEEPIAQSASMRELLALATKVAASTIPVLILGETGSGKEVIARAIHRASSQQGDLVALNCAALPETLAESELFGHVRGAFTGTQGDKRGLFEEADQGTLLLDEVGELPLSIQAKLLRTLEEGTVRPVGATRSIPVSVRIIAATNRDLEAAVERGTFRQDLYFRLKGVTLDVPPLRDRPDDFEALLQRFLAQAAAGRPIPDIAPGTIDALKVRHRRMWPDPARRYCTSDQKRAPVLKLMTKLADEQRERRNRPVRILNCLGLRAEESRARSKLVPFERDERASSGRRSVDRWLPIFAWSLEAVWERIRASGVPYHPAYDLGMPRLSCSFCIFAPPPALILAGMHRPELLAEYVAIEEEIGHTFRHNLSLRVIQSQVEAGAKCGTVPNWAM